MLNTIYELEKQGKGKKGNPADMLTQMNFVVFSITLKKEKRKVLTETYLGNTEP